MSFTSPIPRRHFLHWLAPAGCLAALAPPFLAPLRRPSTPKPAVAHANRKLLLVQFGGGTRWSESMGDPDHRYVPRLWTELVPRGTLFTNMRVEHQVVHPNSTGSMLTGHWEWQDLDWTQPPAHPTIFEIFRRASGASDLQVWAFVYASILGKVGASSAPGFGPDFGANVVEPPTIPRECAEIMDRMMREACADGTGQAGLQTAAACAALARSTSRISQAGLRSANARACLARQYSAWKAGNGSTSHDAFLTECALSCMKTHQPNLLALCLGEIDCAHYGSWSRYVEAIRRTDELTWRLGQAAEKLPAYQDQSLLLILPDHGRELERSDGLGFVHHSHFYTGAGADEGCRRVWMLAIGPDVPRGRVIEKPIPITAVAATGLEFLGLQASSGAAASIWPLLQ